MCQCLSEAHTKGRGVDKAAAPAPLYNTIGRVSPPPPTAYSSIPPSSSIEDENGSQVDPKIFKRLLGENK